MDVSLRPVAEDELAYVEDLLDRNELASADVRQHPDAFYVARTAGESIGIGGLERHGRAGLLRSVVVAEPHRGKGFGAVICAALEERACDADIETVYLLTTTAAAFFAARGYDVVDRERVPGDIRQTTEFADLCPASATCMRKEL